MKQLVKGTLAKPARWVSHALRMHWFHWLVLPTAVLGTNLPLLVYFFRYFGENRIGEVFGMVSRVIITAPHHHYYALMVMPIATTLVAMAHRSMELARESSAPISDANSWIAKCGQSPTCRRLITTGFGVVIAASLGGIQSYSSPVEPCHLTPQWEQRLGEAHELVLSQMYMAPPSVRESFAKWIEVRSHQWDQMKRGDRDESFGHLVHKEEVGEIRNALAEHRSRLEVKTSTDDTDGKQTHTVVPDPVLTLSVDLLIAVRDPDNALLLGDYSIWSLVPNKEPPTDCMASGHMKFLGGIQLASAFFVLWVGIVLTWEYVSFRRKYTIKWKADEAELRAGVVRLSAAIALVSLFSALRYFNQLEIEIVTGRQRADLTSSHVIPLIYVGATLAALILTYPQDRGTKLITSGAPLAMTIGAFAAGYLDFNELRYLMGINDFGQLGLLSIIYLFTIVVLLSNSRMDFPDNQQKDATHI
ncbi:MAG: hypothetical protein KF696_01360 [Planctomycetes bacterium]|nr:hypothetical protein [Planctomycetota bacterium]MCW8134412.1 hypothetical protein [Planctomycetota bacterium]